MKRKKLEILLKKLEKELDLAGERCRQAKADAEHVVKETAYSWSSGGDKEYSRNQAEILQENFENIKKVKEAVEKALTTDTDGKVQTPSYVAIQLEDKYLEFYLVQDPIHLEKVMFLSEDSEIGKAIIGKEAGDEFVINRDAKSIKGRVVSVE